MRRISGIIHIPNIITLDKHGVPKFTIQIYISIIRNGNRIHPPFDQPNVYKKESAEV